MLASDPVAPPILSNSNDVPPSIDVSTGRRITGTLSTGTILAGRYRLVELIRIDGFGTVYKATDERLTQRVVAIRQMNDAQLGPAEKKQALQDFLREARLLASLDHPHLLQMLAFGEEAGKAYLVMEFVTGKTLEKIQEEVRGPLGERLVMGWATQLCDALNYLHTRPNPIIFRDMRPSNVMVTPQDQIKLIDFSIAHVSTSTASKDTISLGSPGYAPLEQYGAGQSDARSDIYALGATLYDLLTNTRPVDALSRCTNPVLFSSPRRLNPSISPAVEAIILKAMAEDPEDRYQSAAEMSKAIAAIGSTSTGTMPSMSRTLAEPGSLHTGTLSPYSYRQAQMEASPLPALPPRRSAPRPRIPLLPVVSRASETVARFFSRRAREKPTETELALFAIARTTLEQDDREAIVGKTYLIQAGISQHLAEHFRGTPFNISVQDPLQPILFHILFHAGENIEIAPGGREYQRLLYHPGHADPQLISCQFQVKAPGRSSLLVNFYRERQWLKTIRFEFTGIEQPNPSPALGRR